MDLTVFLSTSFRLKLEEGSKGLRRKVCSIMAPL